MAKVLIVGSGGREHALGWKLAQSQKVSLVYLAPGNGGTNEGKLQNLPFDASKESSFSLLQEFLAKESIDLILIGPEQPLDWGITDKLQVLGHKKVFGPIQQAVKLETDKFFSYQLMKKLQIPQARSLECSTPEEVRKAIKTLSTSKGIVLKARGLAAGKGVIVCKDPKQAYKQALGLRERYGSDLLVSEKLEGKECSLFSLCASGIANTFPIGFQDHKRLKAGDKGPNTGGMGAFGPSPELSPVQIQTLSKQIIEPILSELARQGTDYQGFLYTGLILTEQGPKVLEFNARFGDPECQSAMLLLESDLYELLNSSLSKSQTPLPIKIKQGHSCCIVLATPEYPNTAPKGLEIKGIEKIKQSQNFQVFHAGTKRKNQQILTNGGRLLGLASYHPDSLEVALENCYQQTEKIKMASGFQYREDIGRD